MQQTTDNAKAQATEGKPAFSIVVPTYGRPRSLPALLRALEATEFPKNRFEVLVVDDGSPEPVAPLLQPFPEGLRLRVIRQPNSGPAAARNRGLREARGEFIVFTDDDCCPHPDWLPLLAEAATKQPEAMVGGHTINGLPESVCATLSQAIIDRLYQVWNTNPESVRFFASNNMLARKECLVALGGFDSAYGRAGGEDRGLCDHWRSSGRRMRYVPEAIVLHFQEEDLQSFIKRHFRYGRGALEYHQRRRTALAGEAAASASITNPLYWIRYAVSRPNGHGVLKMMGLLVVWQVANTGGFFWEYSRNLFKRSRQDMGSKQTG
jgi:glycosyltransferase involved in cell wall biosynthesis